MNFDDSDGELAELIQRPDSDMLRVIPRGVANVANNGRVNPVQRELRREQPQQPQTSPFIINNRTPGAMPSNGGRKKKRTNKHSKKYKNKTYYKNKNRKRHKTRRIKKM